MPEDAFCSDTLYIYTDLDSLLSFHEECNFGIWSSDLYCEKDECMYVLPACKVGQLIADR